MSSKLGPYLLGPNDTPENGIYHGDIRELASSIPDHSIDLIICDPPYLKDDLPIYTDLAKIAKAKLRPGHLLVAHGAGEHLPDHIQRLGEELNFFWLFALLHNGGYPRLWHKQLMSGYKPVLVYSNGKPITTPWMATTHSNQQDKQWHKWGQGTGFFIKMIECLCPLNGIVLDPFCGGGTVPASCIALGRNYLAFEIDKDTCTIARDRVRNTQPPLFIQQAEQPALPLG